MTRTVLVTGVGQHNIGHASAVALARLGYDLIVCDARPIAPETVQALADEYQVSVEALTLDIADVAAARGTLEALVAQHASLAGLVNSAGVARALKPMDITPADWDRLMDVNLKDTFFCCQSFIRALVAAGRHGCVVNLSSMAGKTGGKNNGLHYAASKAGVISITRGLARYAGPHGIRVNAVAPGIIDTVMSHDVPGSDKQAKESPLGRWGSPAEVARVVAFLVGEESSYMTGAVVDVNGGIL